MKRILTALLIALFVLTLPAAPKFDEDDLPLLYSSVDEAKRNEPRSVLIVQDTSAEGTFFLVPFGRSVLMHREQPALIIEESKGRIIRAVFLGKEADSIALRRMNEEYRHKARALNIVVLSKREDERKMLRRLRAEATFEILSAIYPPKPKEETVIWY